MEYKYNGKRATSLGSEGIIITKENSYEATKVTGLKRALINMFKNDKECKKREHLNTVSENTWTVFTLLFEH